ncbi:hypothetical protein [Thermoleptolyngbya sp. M55_K2018_002]|uniref:hypothetical protein n=1 Tax=Thermoleptolyngbya sp. M55_K2018_002 TaxID=2747808 RepID=UPI0019FCCCCE|nr:hypothetical protein [Thermoleptolyngbya sp. M55_K2018_002]HIK42990.1 hypothetical protein [Thermoleptolyngbya sp. M55_K2018_002]
MVESSRAWKTADRERRRIWEQASRYVSRLHAGDRQLQAVPAKGFWLLMRDLSLGDRR